MSRDQIAASVSRETLRRLDIYADLILRWNPKINLVAKGTLSDLWERHLLDSAQVAEMGDGNWVDLGSGGGFPGAVVAILRPELNVTLVESDQRKCAFLRTVSRAVGASFTVLSARIEDLDPQSASTISARALAPLPRMLDYAHRHLSPDGHIVLHKGANVERELNEALENWRFDCEKHPSVTNPDATILKIGALTRV